MLREALSLAVLAGIVSGLAMFAFQTMAMPFPQYSYFLSQLDAQMYEQHWNTLEPQALSFDPVPCRVATVFGRCTRAGTYRFMYWPE